jgi:PAS domain S-box-containing protein
MLWEDDEHALYRGQRTCNNKAPRSVLALRVTAERPRSASADRLAHEYGLKDYLESAWAARPLELVPDRDRVMLVLEDPGGVPLERYLGEPIEAPRFLQLAIGMIAAVGQVHQRGLVHKDLKPAHILVDDSVGRVCLTGFGLASQLPRERQPPSPPAFIAGTLAYMAPEQTGRMNRSIDSRCDLYSLGVVFYQMLTGVLPFTASEPMEWVHCHIARTPVPPCERVVDIPNTISDIVTKMLAKTAEKRYQTAAGVERDLRRCLAEWRAKGCIEPFVPGETDAPDRLSIPEKLYGRTSEINSLLTAFDRVVSDGEPAFVLVSGYSGIGKSAVVNELHKALVPPRGLFASGKFDQYKRDIPYATLAQALRNLVSALLGTSETELHRWRQALLDALGSNGVLIVSLVPELKLIIGDQPPVPALPPRDAQSRFNLVFRRFIDVFARQEHPLALFLDDLQWLDLATLDLLEDLLRQPDVRYLMLIGAYRDNEVSSSHPLMRKLEVIRQSGATVRDIILAPLNCEAVGTLVAESLHCTLKRATSLAKLINRKTGGNPFFAIQFITALVDEGLLIFDHGRGRWSWDLRRIQAKGYTDNIIDFMVGKLNRLPARTQEALKNLACLGNHADLATLSVVHAKSEEVAHADLWEALRLEFIVRSGTSYRFAHDRIQEAAYSLIPEQARARTHLRIGRLLAARTPPEQREAAIFEIVNQLDRGAGLITSRAEREQVAELNLAAARRARASTAYAAALTYLVAGSALVAGDGWEHRHDLTFPLEFHRAECEFLTGDPASAEQRLTSLASHAANPVERATVECLRIDLYITLDQPHAAVAACLDYLQHLGDEWSPHPTEAEVQGEYDRIWSQLGSRAVEDLVDLPLMSDPASLATLDVLTKIYPTAMFVDANLLSMTVCRAVNLSLERGNSDASCVAYVYFGKVAGPHFGDYAAGLKFGRLGYELVEKRGLERFQARTCLWFAQYVLPWSKHVRACRGLMQRAFEMATKVGDMNIAVYSFDNLNTNLLAAGDPLVEAQRQAEIGLEFAKRARFGHQIDIITTQLCLIRTLRGLTYKFGRFDDGESSEDLFEQHYTPNPAVYWIRKLQARFLAGDYRSALDAAERARPMLWTLAAMFETVEYHFYAALAHAACCASEVSGRDGNPSSGRAAEISSISRTAECQEHLGALKTHHRQLAAWAENCPDNFADRAALTAAEIDRIEGRDLDAGRLYERAIRSSQANGFVHNEALANELAARFYLERDLQKVAHAYLQDARQLYLRWGADAKVRQLEELYSQLGHEGPAPGPSTTIGTPIEHLDLATVIKVSQTVSREIVLDRLIETTMRTAVEHAGAERGALIVSRSGELRCVAVASTEKETITVELRDQPMTETALPQSVLQYAMRTQDAVILDDAAAQHPFAEDAYIHQQQARSILCLPLLSQAKLCGLLYLENNLAPRVFVQARAVILKLLASQTAIALENANLYRDVEERETKIRRLVDANIIGTFIWKAAGASLHSDDILLIEANDTFLRMVGYDREDLAAGRLTRLSLTPLELHDRDASHLTEVKMSGMALPFEKEYMRKDGSRVPVLMGLASFDEQRNQGVSFVVDLTERNRTEAEAREAQMALAHANRVATIGQLSASIGHEVNQPLSGVVTNAETGLLWLQSKPPNLPEAVGAFSRVVRDGKRAAEIVNRIRALARKAPPQKDKLYINDVIQEVVSLTRSEAAKYGTLLQMQPAAELPPIQGDRVQLQQVILNLIMNAIEATRSCEAGPKEIRIHAARTEPGDIVVSVRDTGPGIEPANIERVFAAFFTTKSSGLGLGLSICRSIIEAHGGRLWVIQGAPRGAVFQFTLPVGR